MTTETITRRGRKFVAEGVEPHQCRDGRLVQLQVWRGTCRYCGGPYRVRTPAGLARSTLYQSHTFGVVNCERHRRMKGTRKPTAEPSASRIDV